MQEISPTYYRDHFWQVIDGVEKRHGFLLAEDERRYIEVLRQLSVDAVSLYIRLSNRKGPNFRVHKLRYSDIANLNNAISELIKHDLINFYRIGNQIEGEIFDCFTVKELHFSLKGYSFKRFATKPELCDWLNQWDDCRDWLNNLITYDPVIFISPQDLWSFFKFLFFGELTDNLSGFVVKELGHVVNVELKQTELTPFFQERKDADSAYRLAVTYAEFRIIRGTQSASKILDWWQSLAIERSRLGNEAIYLFDRLVGRLGRLLERENENALAINLYQTSPVAPSRERLARLYMKSGENDDAKMILEEMVESENGEEVYVARQLLNRLMKTKKLSDARQLLNLGPILSLDYQTGFVEEAVIQHYKALGWHAIHSENWLWNNLFGLFFWDIIYDTSYGSFNQPLQFAPTDLYKSDFYQKRKNAFEKRLDLLISKADSLVLMHQNFLNNQGTANPFVSWHESLLFLLEVVITNIPANSLQSLLKHMATNLKLHSRGFPDLFIWKDDDYRLIEVKAAGDQLSPQQFRWLKFFADNNINCAVERVEKLSLNLAA